MTAAEELRRLADAVEPGAEHAPEPLSQMALALVDAARAAADRLDRVAAGLDLAANRLNRCAVEAVGQPYQFEWSQWADEARAAVKEAK
jgi:hypothetical protein